MEGRQVRPLFWELEMWQCHKNGKILGENRGTITCAKRIFIFGTLRRYLSSVHPSKTFTTQKYFWVSFHAELFLPHSPVPPHAYH